MEVLNELIQELLPDDKYYYAFRFTPYPNTPANTEIAAWRMPKFFDIIGSENYILGQEFEKNHHFHAVFSILTPLEGEALKDFKETLYTFFEVPKDKIGNPTYSLEDVRDKVKALCYAVKKQKNNEVKISSSEQWSELAVLAHENSKQKKHSMKRSLADLTEDYLKDEINDKELWIGLGQSRADLGLPLSLRWVDEMSFSIQCLKDRTLLEQKWEERIIKEQLKSM